MGNASEFYEKATSWSWLRWRYRRTEQALARAFAVGSSQFYQQLHSERTWEEIRKPYYNVWPSIVPMLTRLNLDLDSALIQLPLPALCIRLPKQHNPLAFQWEDQPFEIRSILLSEINDGRGLSILLDIGEMMDNGLFKVRIYTYRNFPRSYGLTVEQSLASLGNSISAVQGVQIPEAIHPLVNRTQKPASNTLIALFVLEKGTRFPTKLCSHPRPPESAPLRFSPPHTRPFQLWTTRNPSRQKSCQRAS